jgi:hypothetical protein
LRTVAPPLASRAPRATPPARPSTPEAT